MGTENITPNVYHISYMPGSGGNFLSRCLNLHPDINWHSKCIGLNYKEKYDILNYQEIISQKKSKNILNFLTWPEFEQNDYIDIKNINVKNIVRQNHSLTDSQIRITTESKEEFDWSRYQALFKNARFSLMWLKAGLISAHDIGIPCKTLWNFENLTESLTKIEQYIKVEQNITECRIWQKKLWDEWTTTWAPEQIKKTLDKFYYGPEI